MITAVNHSGYSSAVGAITGAILGAKMGYSALPDFYVESLEPVDALSGYRWNNRISYYQETKDASTSFYFDRMRKGTYELTYDVYVTSSGMYQQGIATARSMYAPEFGGHGKSSRLMVK